MEVQKMSRATRLGLVAVKVGFTSLALWLLSRASA